MQSVTKKQMQQIEQASFDRGVKADQLMEQAGLGIAQQILARFLVPGLAIAYLGKGNNAGDALVALKHLHAHGWNIKVRHDHTLSLSELTQYHLHDLTPKLLEAADETLNGPTILLDGLLGIGATGAIRPPLDSLAGEMNTLRSQGAYTIAMDAPSGIDADTGEVYSGAVRADHTCSVAFPKLGVLQEAAVNHVGSISHTPLKELSYDGSNQPQQFITPSSFPKHRRDFNYHKGMAGRVAIIAGSMGMLGAAVLTATGALRAGAGLVTLFCPPSLLLPLSLKAPAEVMVKSIKDSSELSLFEPFDCIAIGPGIGTGEHSSAGKLSGLLKALITTSSTPLVIDADGLNFLAQHRLVDQLTSNCILTPHPGEMRRLLGNEFCDDRNEALTQLTTNSNATVLYKGARTLISEQPTHSIYTNGTGTPGMATAGQGDLLTGVIAGLCAQGIPNLQACCMGAWLCGRASELATQSIAPEALITTDTASAIGAAFQEWHRGNPLDHAIGNHGVSDL